MRQTVKRIPIVGPLIRKIYRTLKPLKPFKDSASYWEERYKSGGTSGDGSYGKLALFKARIVNDFVKEQQIHDVIEHGCGDGNQLKLAQYKSYIGFDVSPESIAICRKIFESDSLMSFCTNDEYGGETAELSLSLDVLFHLVEDTVFENYMKRLFQSASRFVIIYSSNIDREAMRHERHRVFTTYVENNFPGWELVQKIPNDYSQTVNGADGSLSDFYIYKLHFSGD